MAAAVIETGRGLRPDELDLAAELGPSQVRAPAELAEMTRACGFRAGRTIDVTDDFERVVGSLLQGLHDDEEALRVAEGDEEYEHEVARRSDMLDAIRRGLIRRTLVVAMRP